MKSIKVSAPGKIHLLGEHTVVYGKPSILAAVDKRCYVSVTPRRDKMIKIISNVIARRNDEAISNINQKGQEIATLPLVARNDEESILEKTKTAQKKWNEFSTSNNSFLLKSIIVKPLDYVVVAIGETFLYYNQPIVSGFAISIDSEVTSGMGSSSSVAVAVVGAVSLFLGKKFDREVINEIAFRCEQKQHGFPSGGDNSVSTYGGLVWYRKETTDLKIIQPISFPLAKNISKNFFLINTGKPKESTGEMVSLVKDFVKKYPVKVEKIFNDQEVLVRNFLSAIKNNNEKEIMQSIKNGEKNLEKLGVVSSYVKGLIRKIEESGGVAKICGAGGKTKEAGSILVHHKNRNILKSLLKSYNLSYLSVSFGTEGLRVEK